MLEEPQIDDEFGFLGDPSPKPPASKKGVTKYPGTRGQWNAVEHGDELKKAYREKFGKDPRVTSLGQDPTHDRLKWDHRASMDIGVHPDSAEGKWLDEHLRSQGIPFTAFSHAIPGVATGAHFHVGNPSHRLGDPRASQKTAHTDDEFGLLSPGPRDKVAAAVGGGQTSGQIEDEFGFLEGGEANQPEQQTNQAVQGERLSEPGVASGQNTPEDLPELGSIPIQQLVSPVSELSNLAPAPILPGGPLEEFHAQMKQMAEAGVQAAAQSHADIEQQGRVKQALMPKEPTRAEMVADLREKGKPEGTAGTVPKHPDYTSAAPGPKEQVDVTAGQPMAESEMYDAWYQARKSGDTATMKAIGQNYSEQFPDGRYKRFIDQANQKAPEPVKTPQGVTIVLGKKAPSSVKELSGQIAQQMGFTPEEAADYEKELGRNPFYSDVKDEKAALESIYKRRDPNTNEVQIPFTHEASAQSAKDWLTGHRAQKAADKVQEYLDGLSKMDDTDKMDVRDGIASHRALTPEEDAALQTQAEKDLAKDNPEAYAAMQAGKPMQNIIGGVMKGAGSRVAGIGRAMDSDLVKAVVPNVTGSDTTSVPHQLGRLLKWAGSNTSSDMDFVSRRYGIPGETGEAIKGLSEMAPDIAVGAVGGGPLGVGAMQAFGQYGEGATATQAAVNGAYTALTLKLGSVLSKTILTPNVIRGLEASTPEELAALESDAMSGQVSKAGMAARLKNAIRVSESVKGVTPAAEVGATSGLSKTGEGLVKAGSFVAPQLAINAIRSGKAPDLKDLGLAAIMSLALMASGEGTPESPFGGERPVDATEGPREPLSPTGGPPRGPGGIGGETVKQIPGFATDVRVGEDVPEVEAVKPLGRDPNFKPSSQRPDVTQEEITDAQRTQVQSTRGQADSGDQGVSQESRTVQQRGGASGVRARSEPAEISEAQKEVKGGDQLGRDQRGISGVVRTEPASRAGEKAQTPEATQTAETLPRGPERAQSAPSAEAEVATKTKGGKPDEIETHEGTLPAQANAPRAARGSETGEVESSTRQADQRRQTLHVDEKGGEIVSEEPARVPGVQGIVSRERDERRKAERTADTDQLTGLANRRALDQALPAAEKDPNTSVVVFDANNFGQVNKVAGQATGDKALTEIASAVQQAAQEFGSPRVFRRGGDELVVLAPKDQADKIKARAEEIYGDRKYGTAGVSLTGSVGNTFDEADRGLQGAKRERKVQGIRAPKAPAATPTPKTSPSKQASSPSITPTSPSKTAAAAKTALASKEAPAVALRQAIAKIDSGDTSEESIAALATVGKAAGLDDAAIKRIQDLVRTVSPVGSGSRSVKTPTLEHSINSTASDTKSLSDIIKTESFRVKGLSGLDVPTQNRVLDLVFTAAHNPEVLDSIVRSLPVDVVDYLRGQQLTPEMLFHNKPMLQDWLGVPTGHDVPVLHEMAASIIGKAALAATEVLTRNRPRPSFASSESLSALGTIERRHDVAPSSDVVLEGEDVDPSSPSRIIAEAPAIFRWRERGFLATNDSGMAALNSIRNRQVYGATLTGDVARKLAGDAREAATKATIPQIKQNLRDLASALEDAAQRAPNVAIVLDKFMWSRKTIRHELFHAAQLALAQIFKKLPDESAINKLPYFDEIKAGLAKRGYPERFGAFTLASEGSAFIAAGQRELLGLSTRQALEFMHGYFGLVAETYGSPEALKAFQDLIPEYRRLRDAVVQRLTTGASAQPRGSGARSGAFGSAGTRLPGVAEGRERLADAAFAEGGSLEQTKPSIWDLIGKEFDIPDDELAALKSEFAPQQQADEFPDLAEIERELQNYTPEQRAAALAGIEKEEARQAREGKEIEKRCLNSGGRYSIL